uniref:Uncharacterized protein n=1 Tax=Oryza punctata TaxID=4537 RepID=A0A0E0LCV0_ORYPU
MADGEEEEEEARDWRPIARPPRAPAAAGGADPGLGPQATWLWPKDGVLEPKLLYLILP